MPEHHRPQHIEEILEDFDRRLAALESAPQARFTSVRDGFLRVLPANGGKLPSLALESNLVGAADVGLRLYDATTGEQRIYLGSSGSAAILILYDADGVEGVRLDDNEITVSGGALRLVDDDGVTYGYFGLASSTPFIAVDNADRTARAFGVIDGRHQFPMAIAPWVNILGLDASGYVTTSSGSYIELMRTIMPATSNGVGAGIYWATPGGVTMAVKLTAEVHTALHTSGASNGEQQVWEQTGLTGSGLINRVDALPQTLWTPSQDVVGSSYTLRVYGRVTGGSGAVGVKAAVPAHSHGV